MKVKLILNRPSIYQVGKIKLIAGENFIDLIDFETLKKNKLFNLDLKSKLIETDYDPTFDFEFKERLKQSESKIESNESNESNANLFQKIKTKNKDFFPSPPKKRGRPKKKES